jgi:hypothetical protein
MVSGGCLCAIVMVAGTFLVLPSLKRKPKGWFFKFTYLIKTMHKPTFYAEDTIDFEHDREQEIYDLILEGQEDEEIDYPEYDDVPVAF